MKRYASTLLFFYLILLNEQASAQHFQDTENPREIKSLISKGNDLKGFGGGDIKVGNIHTQRALLLGAYGGVLVNRNFMLGLAGYGIATNPRFDGLLLDDTPKKLTIHGGYAGVMLGGILFSKELVHLSFPMILGAGAIQLSDENFLTTNFDNEVTIESSVFFVGEQAAELEFNITRSFRIGLGASYRLVRGLQMKNLTDNDLSNWTAQLSLKFGRF